MPRILVADDSLFVRAAVRGCLERAGYEIVGEAASGEEALALNLTHRPDLIVLDLRMPGMDGLEAIERIMAEAPTRILVLSGQIEVGGESAIRALQAGAAEVLEKPSTGDLRSAGRRIQRAVERVLGTKVLDQPWNGGELPEAARELARTRAGYRVVVIGASTGGPRVLTDLLGALPTDFPVPVLVAQHVQSGWSQTLAEMLSSTSALPVREARHDEPLEPGQVYLAPGEHDLEITSSWRTRLVGGRPGPHPSASRLLNSAAAVCSEDTLALILTGMGSDGREGARAVRAAGGVVIAQSESTCLVWGMPRATVEAELADVELSPRQMARYLSAG